MHVKGTCIVCKKDADVIDTLSICTDCISNMIKSGSVHPETRNGLKALLNAQYGAVPRSLNGVLPANLETSYLEMVNENIKMKHDMRVLKRADLLVEAVYEGIYDIDDLTDIGIKIIDEANEMSKKILKNIGVDDDHVHI